MVGGGLSVAARIGREKAAPERGGPGSENRARGLPLSASFASLR